MSSRTTHCNTLQRTCVWEDTTQVIKNNTLQHAAAHMCLRGQDSKVLAVCCSVLQCVVLVLSCPRRHVCCSVLQRVAVCCSVLQRAVLDDM